jgi:hypothetical protein
MAAGRDRRLWVALGLVGAALIGGVTSLALARPDGASTTTVPTASTAAPTTAPATMTTATPPTTKQATTTTSRPARVRPSSTTKAPSRPARGSLLSRRDVASGGVPRLMDFTAGGPSASECDDRNAAEFDSPTVVVPGGTEDRPSVGVLAVTVRNPICFFTFAPDEPIDVELTAPDGRQVSYEVCSTCAGDGGGRLRWVGMPDDPLGRYEIVAKQAGVTRTGSFTLKPPGERSLLVAEGWGATGRPVPVGSTIHIGLAGFASGQQVQVSFYYAAVRKPFDARATHVASISLRMDGQGQRLYALASRASDPKGCYIIDTDPDYSVAVSWEQDERFCLA